MRKSNTSTQSAFSWKSRLLFALGGLVLASSGAKGQTSPLPGIKIQSVRPVITLLADLSASAAVCDAAPPGGFIPAVHLRKNPAIPPGTAGHFLYDPRNGSDGGACPGLATRGAVWTDSTTPFEIDRMEAVKLAVSNLLDATGDGVIDQADELVLDVHLGLASFSGASFQIISQIGSPFAYAWGQLRIANTTSGGVSGTGHKMWMVRSRMYAPCYDGAGSKTEALPLPGSASPNCYLPPAEKLANGDDFALACRKYYLILLTAGAPNANTAGVDKDPARMAKAFRDKTKISTETTPGVVVYTAAVGIGEGVVTVGSETRGGINCATFQGGFDANYDRDNDPSTMSLAGTPAYLYQTDLRTSSGNIITIDPQSNLPGDLFLLMVTQQGADALNDTLTPATITSAGTAGWTQLAAYDRGTTQRVWIFWARAASSSAPDVTVTINENGTINSALKGMIAVFRGATTANPPFLAGLVSTSVDLQTTGITIAGVTTTVDKTLVVSMVFSDNEDDDIQFPFGWIQAWNRDADDDSWESRFEGVTKEFPNGGTVIPTMVGTGAPTSLPPKISGSDTARWSSLMIQVLPPTGSPLPIVNRCDINDGSGANPGFDGDNPNDFLATSGSCEMGARAHVCGLGNGYFPQDSDQLESALKAIFGAVNSGSFSGSPPTVSLGAGGVSTGAYVYASFFDVKPYEIHWFGHLRKYRFSSVANGYVHCDTGLVASVGSPDFGVPRPCWDAAGSDDTSAVQDGYADPNPADSPPTFGYQVVNSGGFGMLDENGDPHYGLSERHWTTRRVFAANPANLLYNVNTEAEYSTRPTDDACQADTGAGCGAATRSVKNMVAALVNGLVSWPPSASTVGLDASLLPWTAISSFATPTTTFALADPAATVTDANIEEALKAFMFAAGRPISTLSDESRQRCSISPDCTDNVPSVKLLDAYHSRPVIVGPPAGVSTDPTYVGTFFATVLSPTAITGGEDVVEASGAYVVSSNGVAAATLIASPCGETGAPATPVGAACKVSTRRKVLYVGGNDGMIHAFDELSGHELWTFIAPSHMRKLKDLRSDRTLFTDGAFSVRDVKFPLDASANFADGKWHTVLISTQGQGGNFFYAMDVTNPVNPVFLWEYRKPQKLGLTVARAVIGEIPAPVSGVTTHNSPGAVVFASGGVAPGLIDSGDPTRHAHFFTLRVHTGEALDDDHTPVKDLPDASTSPAAILNGLVGEPRPVDANLDGRVDRVYFGDTEGRMWKACNITETGTFTVELFFDPATYDDPAGAARPGGLVNVANPGDPTDNQTLLTRTPLDRKQLRGPIYFPADVTHDGTGQLIVAFGSGNIFDPLQPPQGYNNFLWVVADNEGSGSASCGAAKASTCNNSVTCTTGNEDLCWKAPLAPDGNGSIFSDLLPVDKVLTGSPFIIQSYLVYAEFERLPVSTGCGSSAYESRVQARDVFGCGIPGSPLFRDSTNTPTNTITYQNTLVTGLQVDPQTGNIFVQRSAGSGPAGTIGAPNLAAKMLGVGWRQRY